MYETTYRNNPETGKYIIDIALDEYLDFFHEWDNTSFKKRDMHPELAEFFDLCSEDIPLKKGLEIHFCMGDENVNEEKEKMIKKSYDHYYEFFVRITKKKIKSNFSNSLALAVMGIGLILANAVMVREVPENLWSEVALKGLYIGGYVFFWESLYSGYFGSKELIIRKKELLRLRKARIFFKYNNC